MKNTAIALVGYGAFLILVGLLGYLSNPEKAKTALMSGGTFGLINIVLGYLASRNWRRSVPVALAVAAFLSAIFCWRVIVTWNAFASGNSDKLVPGLLITSMLFASVAIAVYLIRKLRGGSAHTAAG